MIQLGQQHVWLGAATPPNHTCCCSRCIIRGSYHKYHFCRDKTQSLTNTHLSRQTRVCRDKTRLLSRKKYACRVLSRQNYVCVKGFVTTSIILSRQKRCFVAIKVNFARQTFWREKIIFGAIKFVWRDKSIGATSILLLRQKTCFFWCFLSHVFCRNKSMLAATKLLSQRNYVCDKGFVTTSILLLRQKRCFVATNTGLS